MSILAELKVLCDGCFDDDKMDIIANELQGYCFRMYFKSVSEQIRLLRRYMQTISEGKMK
jgi:hypothetical protein